MTVPIKYRRLVLMALGILLLIFGCFAIILLNGIAEFRDAEEAKGHWVSIQNFVKANGRYPKDEAEIGTFFHETPDELKEEPVEYIAPHDPNGDEVILWCKNKTIFGVRIGIKKSGTVVKQ
jgi:hypothetical protein